VIISLTHQQWVSLSVRLPEEWKAAMKANRSKMYGRTHRYELPAACWRAIFDHASKDAFGPLGGRTRAKDSLYSALSKIVRDLHRIEQHPALTPGLACRGWLPDVIPAWDSRPKRSCYPVDAPYVLLVPHHFVEREWQLTVWKPSAGDGQAHRRLYREDVQALILGQFGIEVGGRQLG
jgi:hypothetical protein